jgi:phosphoribosylaminoimidazole-succinocarboxamide synthase
MSDAAPGIPPAPEIEGAEHLHSGKVRDLYRLSGDRLLMVASDRISAFDFVLDTTIPDKGEVLTRMSLWWFRQLEPVAPSHVLSTDVPPEVAGRAVVCERLDMYPVECVARGYLTGSGLLDYRASGEVCGIALPEGLEDGSRLPEPIFTPATKAASGHDENISFAEVEKLIGAPLAAKVRDVSIRLYKEAAEYAATRGIIIADTKFEFGLDSQNNMVLIDEVLTADSSRFWPADSYRVGISPPSYDKQYVRDYLETLDWNKAPPAPKLPSEVIAKTSQKYREALEKLTGKRLNG